MSDDYIKQVLQKRNLSLTVQRRIILEVLNKDQGHLTAEDIFLLVKKRLPQISLGTVYRNLEILVSLDLIDQHKIGTKKALFEIKKPPHYHVICDKCGRIDDLNGIHINRLEDEIARITGYKILSHDLNVIGICPECRTNKIQIQDLSEE